MKLAVLLVDLMEGIDHPEESGVLYEYGSVAEGLDTIEEVVREAKRLEYPIFGTEPIVPFTSLIAPGSRLPLHARFRHYIPEEHIFPNNSRDVLSSVGTAEQGSLRDSLRSIGITHLLIVGFDRDYCVSGAVHGAYGLFRAITSEALTFTHENNEAWRREQSLQLFQERTHCLETATEVLAYLANSS